jgi:hypothetical protein
VRRALNTDVGITHPADFDRNGRINSLDLAAAKAALSRTLAPPPPTAPAAAEVARVWDERAEDVLGGAA